MKIIGQAPGGRLLCDMSDEEAANILGFSSTYSNGFKREEIKPGCEIKVGEIFTAFSSLVDSQAKLKEQIKLHSELIENLKRVTETIEPAASKIKALKKT